MIDELDKFLNNAIEHYNLLMHDVESIKYTEATGKEASKKSLERITPFRKSISEAKEVAKLDPDEQFIFNQINDLFNGV